MKIVVVSIQNGLLAEAITHMLRMDGEFHPHCVKSGRKNSVVHDCVAVNADILLMEASYAGGASVETRIQEAAAVRSRIPGCKMVLLCDENSTPDIARDIQKAKKDGAIDAFFYTSVSGSYLVAALDAL